MTEPITILIADDHTMFRQGLRELLERKGGFKVVAEVSDGLAAVQQAREHRPDIALLDISMPGITGIEAARQVASASPATRTVVLTMHRDERTVLEALRAGANAYLLKDADSGELVLRPTAFVDGDGRTLCTDVDIADAAGVVVAAGASHPVTLTVTPAADAAPGRYHGMVLVGGVADALVHVCVDVQPTEPSEPSEPFEP